jgi:hypothetical protein
MSIDVKKEKKMCAGHCHACHSGGVYDEVWVITLGASSFRLCDKDRIRLTSILNGINDNKALPRKVLKGKC